MKKKYVKPVIKEVKLSISDTLLTACRSAQQSRVNPRRGTQCQGCRATFRAS
jgi:hypothetical protein